eukprot:6661167-Karenia_brevis.AAC.1
METREQFWPVIREFGVIFIAYWGVWGLHDSTKTPYQNHDYLKQKAEQGLKRSHTVRIWPISERSKAGEVE